jgi:hypothetical protein
MRLPSDTTAEAAKDPVVVAEGENKEGGAVPSQTETAPEGNPGN